MFLIKHKHHTANCTPAPLLFGLLLHTSSAEILLYSQKHNINNKNGAKCLTAPQSHECYSLNSWRAGLHCPPAYHGEGLSIAVATETEQKTFVICFSKQCIQVQSKETESGEIDQLHKILVIFLHCKVYNTGIHRQSYSTECLKD